MPIGEALEITGAWLELPIERERKVLVAAARATRRKVAEFESATVALQTLGLRFGGTIMGASCHILDASELSIDEGIDLDNGKLFRALAAGVDDGFMVIWDTRQGRREVLDV